VEALARKDFTEYDRLRVPVAETLGIRLGTLDDKVEAAREARSSQGSAIVVEDIEPWAEPVHGAALLDEMSKAMTAHENRPIIAPAASYSGVNRSSTCKLHQTK